MPSSSAYSDASAKNAESTLIKNVNSLMRISFAFVGEYRNIATTYTTPATSASTMISGTILESRASKGMGAPNSARVR